MQARSPVFLAMLAAMDLGLTVRQSLWSRLKYLNSYLMDMKFRKDIHVSLRLNCSLISLVGNPLPFLYSVDYCDAQSPDKYL